METEGVAEVDGETEGDSDGDGVGEEVGVDVTEGEGVIDADGVGVTDELGVIEDDGAEVAVGVTEGVGEAVMGGLSVILGFFAHINPTRCRFLHLLTLQYPFRFRQSRRALFLSWRHMDLHLSLPFSRCPDPEPNRRDKPMRSRKANRNFIMWL